MKGNQTITQNHTKIKSFLVKIHKEMQNTKNTKTSIIILFVILLNPEQDLKDKSIKAFIIIDLC